MASTLNDVINVAVLVQRVEGLFGRSREFAETHNDFCNRFKNAFKAERGSISDDDASRLPTETPLGEESQKVFDEWLAWLRSQHDTLINL